MHGHSSSLVYTASPKNGMKAKRLQGCHRRWRIGEASDVWVGFGTKVNATVAAFLSLGINFS